MGIEGIKNQQPVAKTETVPLPTDAGQKYEGYSEVGMIEDQNAEQKAEKLINDYIGKLDEIQKNYLGSTNEGSKKAGLLMLNELKNELDRKVTSEVKSAMNYNSTYDGFLRKYTELKMSQES